MNFQIDTLTGKVSGLTEPMPQSMTKWEREAIERALAEAREEARAA